MTILLFFPLLLLHIHIQVFQPVQALPSIALPLAVRSPYLSYWLPQNGSATISDQFHPSPTKSDLSKERHWYVSVRVDGMPYSIFGSLVWPGGGGPTSFPQDTITLVTITNTVVTPTRTILTAAAGPMQVNLTFLNPVEPGDWVKQSIPFSYLSLTAVSLDNSAHKVEVYSHISPRLITTDVNRYVLPNVTSNANIIYHALTFGEPIPFSEELGTDAGWGTLYYAMKTESNITYSVDKWFNAVSIFISDGALNNQGGITTTPVFVGAMALAMSCDLGTIQATQAPIVWAIGFTTDPAISYANQSDMPPQQRKPYYKLRYADDDSLVVDFLNDFHNASERAQQLDQKILQDAASISGLLSDLVTLAVPQVYGSSQLTIGTDANDKFNESDVMMFMKNVGGDIPNRVNAVETLYAAFPAIMYIDPTLGKPLLEPLFRLQASPDYDVQFAAGDLGSSYPNVSADRSIHQHGIEQTGNMLIMTYAHARASGDGSLILRYYPLLTSWANYLSDTALENSHQSDTDGDGITFGARPNLAIKGIIAIGAMSKMSSFAGKRADADYYFNKTASLYGQWKIEGLAGDQHLLSVSYLVSWTIGYNLFADKWLGTEVVEASVYEGHSSFLNNIPPSTFSLAAGADKSFSFILPIGSLHTEIFTIVSGWNLFVAAMTPNDDLRSNLISSVHARASPFVNQCFGIFPHRYYITNGSAISGMASPAQGAMFAPLALKIAVKDINFNSNMTTNMPSKSSHVSVITKAIIGCVAALLCVAGIISFVLWDRRIRRYNNRVSSWHSSSAMRPVSALGLTPFILTHLGATHSDSGYRNGRQQPQSGSPEAATANADAGNPSYSSPHSDTSSRSFPFIPIGLSAKRLARMRAETLRPRPALTHPVSDQTRSQTPSLLVASTVQREPTTSPMFQALQSQFDRLRREVQQLRAERSNTEAPPSYAEGNAG